ncbi:PREDICTED: larval cuticle protein A2B [Rhagoletis zephyria]|uniref:larval cuticle protein A2B n=1 Tax=Rhagoletis zephyria TaxID=28612 RepID=UPI0008114C23|nr:PREDICTED: larval cuticle protein A2B [Rhagoletis zephyria]
MITKVALVLCFGLSLAVASPIDAYGHGGGYAISAPIAYAAPAISYAAPKILAAAPAISHQVIHAPAPAPAIALAPAPAIIKAAPAVAVAKVIEPEPYDPNPQYSFSYGVTDHHTGDSKSAEESLVDGVVHGSYSLAEPDGSIRKVTYTADKINGFNAVVEKQGGQAPVVVAKPAVAVAAVPAIAKVAYAAPAIAKVAYAAPALHYGHP